MCGTEIIIFLLLPRPPATCLLLQTAFFWSWNLVPLNGPDQKAKSFTTAHETQATFPATQRKRTEVQLKDLLFGRISISVTWGYLF